MSDISIMSKEDYFAVLDEIKSHILDAQKAVMNTANVERNIMYWRIGKTIVQGTDAFCVSAYLSAYVLF